MVNGKLRLMVRDKKGEIQVEKKNRTDQRPRSDGNAIKSKEYSRAEVIQKSTEMAQGWVLKDIGKQSR